MRNSMNVHILQCTRLEYAMAAPSLRRRRLASTLQQLRKRAGLNVTDAAKLAGFSQTKLTRIEKAEVRISGDDTHALCRALEIPADVTEELVKLARQAKQRGWWQTYPDSVLGRATDLLELEADAATKHTFNIDTVPGLLQTEDYARAVIRSGFPRESAEVIQARVDMRMERQRRIEAGELELWAIIDECALRKPIGGSAVMGAQVQHLAEVARGRHVSVQVLPTALPGHAALGTPFSLSTLADGYECAAVDNLTGGLYIEGDSEVRGYRDTWAKLAAVALSFDDSADLLSDLADDHRRQIREPGRQRRVAESEGVG